MVIKNVEKLRLQMICSLNSLPYLIPSNQTGTCSQLYTLSLNVLKLLLSAFEKKYFSEFVQVSHPLTITKSC